MPLQNERTIALYDFDARVAQSQRAALLCGIDEAGRGPLCGPVAVGAVILDYTRPVDGIDDSKKLSEGKRAQLYEQIVDCAVSWHVELVPPAEIDRLNILQAVLQGMQSAFAKLQPAPDLVLVDGNRCPEFGVPHQLHTKGDGKSAAIAAASILAKVTRDRFMTALGEQYPQYELDKHKGYPAKRHYEILDLYGPQTFYRQSFLKKWRSHGPKT